MQGIGGCPQYQRVFQGLVAGLKELYGEQLISLILYGSAASGEFIHKRSNLNVLVVLDNCDLENIRKSSHLFRRLHFVSPLFFDESYIQKSTDTFPIEFLDMKENYRVLYGKDVLQGVVVDMRNLRFQCEQELKAKVISLKKYYLAMHRDGWALRDFFFKAFGSVLHLVRNVIRIKGESPAYRKAEVIEQASRTLPIDKESWLKILAAKNKEIKLGRQEQERLFMLFVRETEKIADIVDGL
jgi:predicted nucleotidyltransferase